MSLFGTLRRILDPRIPTGPESDTWPGVFELSRGDGASVPAERRSGAEVGVRAAVPAPAKKKTRSHLKPLSELAKDLKITRASVTFVNPPQVPVPSALSPLDAVTGGTCQVRHVITRKVCDEPATGWFIFHWPDGEMRIRACPLHSAEIND